MPITETFHGFIESTTDTLLVFEACRQGILPKINRRLQERERGAVKSGTVFVFDEKESGIKRWTDGLVWSPSRILGNFLIYRELDGRELLDDKTLMSNRQYNEEYKTSDRERALVGSLTDTYKFKTGGLIKKTLSIQVNGSSQHLISYYTKEDVLCGKLASPSTIPDIASVRISPELFMQQNFRIPLSLEYPENYKRLSLSSSPCSSNDSVSPRRRSSALLLEMAHPYIDNDTQYYSRRRLSSSDLDSPSKRPCKKAQLSENYINLSTFPVSSHKSYPPQMPPHPTSWFHLPKYTQKVSENNFYYDNKRNTSQVRSFTSFDPIDIPLEPQYFFQEQ